MFRNQVFLRSLVFANQFALGVAMTAVQIEPFLDNWAYLKTELNWLERLLMVAIARQRQEGKEVDRVAQSQADRITSHWWKGLILIEGGGAYEDRKPPEQSKHGNGGGNLQQQVDARIQASRSQGIILGLPWLRDRLRLTVFEKNLLLLSLAPEVNRRYARLYQYLQTGEGRPDFRAIDAKTGKSTNLQISATICNTPTDLPTIDLALRLLCRNDAEWRAAYQLLADTSPLVQLGLLKRVGGLEDTLLTSRLKISPTVVNYLLADKPDPTSLEVLLETQQTLAAPKPPPSPNLLQQLTPTIDISQLILPSELLADLQYLAHRLQPNQSTSQLLGWPSCQQRPPLGIAALFTGITGTGKTAAAQAIARSLNLPLTWIDLALLDPTDYQTLLQSPQSQASPVLLVKSAHRWLGRRSPLQSTILHRWLADRRSQKTLTIFSTHQLPFVTTTWQHQMDAILSFPRPKLAARLQLWQCFLPSHMSIDPKLDWTALARRFALTGGEIQQALHDAVFYALAEAESKPDQPMTLRSTHILKAIRQQPRFRRL